MASPNRAPFVIYLPGSCLSPKLTEGATCVDGPSGEVEGGPESSNAELKPRPRQVVRTSGMLEEPDPIHSLEAMWGDPGPHLDCKAGSSTQAY